MDQHNHHGAQGLVSDPLAFVLFEENKGEERERKRNCVCEGERERDGPGWSNCWRANLHSEDLDDEL